MNKPGQHRQALPLRWHQTDIGSRRGGKPFVFGQKERKCKAHTVGPCWEHSKSEESGGNRSRMGDWEGGEDSLIIGPRVSRILYWGDLI